MPLTEQRTALHDLAVAENALATADTEFRTALRRCLALGLAGEAAEQTGRSRSALYRLAKHPEHDGRRRRRERLAGRA